MFILFGIDTLDKGPATSSIGGLSEAMAGSVQSYQLNENVFLIGASVSRSISWRRESSISIIGSYQSQLESAHLQVEHVKSRINADSLAPLFYFPPKTYAARSPRELKSPRELYLREKSSLGKRYPMPGLMPITVFEADARLYPPPLPLLNE